MSLFRTYLFAGLLMLLAPFAHGAEFMLGLDVFLQRHTGLVAGERVGLVTNQTGLNAEGVSTIDLLHRHPRVNLVALFAAEHGIRGEVAAGEHVGDERDARTGLPIFSLYGQAGRKPNPQMMAQVDVLIYDMQDVGSRAYTYIWTMANCMAAVGEAGKRMIILDRPNPLGGRVIDGPVTEPQWKSFLGLHPIPRVYGMTVGELALLFQDLYHRNAEVTVVPMARYTRDMAWSDTKLPWKAPSPNIPSPMSAVCFAATGTIGELRIPGLDIGIGTERAFQVVGAPWLDARRSAEALNYRQLPGVRFEAVSLRRNGADIPCVRINVTAPTRFHPCVVEAVILQHLMRTYPQQAVWPTDAETLRRFDNAMGTSSLRQDLQAGKSVNEIIATWQGRQESFRRQRQRFLRYP